MSNNQYHECGAVFTDTDGVYRCEPATDDPHDDGNFWLVCTTHDHLIRTVEIRTATIKADSVGWGGDPLKVVQQYLPSNYTAEIVPALYDEGDQVVVTGWDKAGWTLDGYIIPRLASGMIYATEVTS
jgi:hypothetical protein